MFVQIGSKAFNPALIQEVWFWHNKCEVTLYGVGYDMEPLTFRDEEYTAFCYWWARKADVYVALADEEEP